MYFEKFAQKGRAFINEIAIELGDQQDPKRALRITKAVLHALRNKISPEESLQMISQLPLYVKAIYVDNWKLHTSDVKIRHVEDFLGLVKKELGVTKDHDLRNLKDTEDATRAVFKVLQNHVSKGEIQDIKNTLPRELSELFEY